MVYIYQVYVLCCHISCLDLICFGIFLVYMFRPDMFWYILGIYLVYTKYIRITKGIYQVYTLYMTCYVDICTHETFLYAKVSHMSGIYQVYFWYVPEINYQYNIECVCSIIVGTCVVGVIVRVVLGFQTAKGETDMPTGCDVCQLLLRRSTGEQSSERDSDILKWERHTQSHSHSHSAVPHAVSVFFYIRLHLGSAEPTLCVQLIW